MTWAGRRPLLSTLRDRGETFQPLHRPTHRQGRARIDSNDEDDDDGDAGTAVGGSRAAGGDDVDWEGIQEEE